MIPDAILIARDLFPDLYMGIKFNYEAMWAFSCRHRFVSHIEVLRNIRGIRERHPFKISRFILYALIHETAVVRRKLLDLIMPTGQFERTDQENILQFARALAARPVNPVAQDNSAQTR